MELYYPLPLPFESIIERKDFYKCDLKSSVRQKIHLVLVSFFGESRYDPGFGCEVWEHDFENIGNVNAWKDRVMKSISESLQVHEKRIDKIRVSINIQAEELGDERFSKSKQIRKRLDVEVISRLVKTDEEIKFSEPIYISPISLD